MEQPTITAMTAPELVDLRDHKQRLERENSDLRTELNAAKQNQNKLRVELSSARVKCDRLERQIAGYDEDASDPTKQKGIGAIPVDLGYGPDLSQVEAIERRLGMAPTVDAQLRAAFGTSIAATDHLLTEGGQEIVVSPDSEYIDAVVEADENKQMGLALQLLWKTLMVLRDGADGGPAARGGAGTAIDTAELAALMDGIKGLPISLLKRHVDIDGWDGEGLPPLK